MGSLRFWFFVMHYKYMIICLCEVVYVRLCLCIFGFERLCLEKVFSVKLFDWSLQIIKELNIIAALSLIHFIFNFVAHHPLFPHEILKNHKVLQSKKMKQHIFCWICMFKANLLQHIFCSIFFGTNNGITFEILYCTHIFTKKRLN